MRAMAVGLLVLSGCASPAPPSGPAAAPAVADQVWQGTIRCDAIPSRTTLALAQRITLSVEAGQASFIRNVLKADTPVSSGFHETASGVVAADGRLTLAGQGLGEGNSSYTSSYAGTLPQAPGSQGELVGHQLWHFSRGPDYDRHCTLRLRRQG